MKTTTTEQKHTPGPWHIGLAATDRAIYGPQGEHVATLPDMLASDEVLANARLIAAAPCLLAALQRLMVAPCINYDDMEPEDLNAIEQAQDAIANATGGQP